MMKRDLSQSDGNRIDPIAPHASKPPGLSALLMPMASRFWLILLIVFGISALSVWAIPKIIIQNDLMFMLPEDNGAKNQYQDAEVLLGNAGGIAIAIQSPKGIYQPDLLQRVRELAVKCRELNLRIPARQLARQLQLSPEQSLAVAGWLQSMASDPDFTPQMVSEALSAPGELMEILYDSLPPFLEVDDADAFSEELAEELAAAAASRPALADDLFRFADQTTDRRRQYRNAWVDDVVALTETDTVWPEITDHTGIHAALAPFDLDAGPDLDRFADTLLETGAIRPDAIADFAASHSKPEDISDAFWNALPHKMTGPAATALAQAMSESPKQIRVGPLVPRKITAQTMAAIRQRLHAWSFFQEGIYSRDEKSLLIVVRTTPNLDQANRELLLGFIREDMARIFNDGRYTIQMAGYSVVDEAVAHNMRRDIVYLLPLVFGVVSLFLFLTFRNLAGVLYPMITVVLTVSWCVGAMALLETPFSLVCTAMPVLMVAVGSAYGIHLVYYFTHRQTSITRPGSAVADTLDGTGRGVIMAGLTTVAGFASLAFNDIVPLRDFGIYTALGVFIALAVSLTLIPALLLRFGARTPSGRHGQGKRVDGSTANKMIRRISRSSARHPVVTLMISGVILLVAMLGFRAMRVETNNVGFFKKGTPIRQADTFINQHFAGTVDIRVLFKTSEPNGILNPKVLDTMDRMADALEHEHPQIGKTLSVLDLIRKMNQAFYYNDPTYYRIPKAAELAGEQTETALKAHLASYIDKYARDDTRAFIDGAKQQAALTLQIKTPSSEVSRNILHTIDRLLAGPMGRELEELGVKVQTTGMGALYVETERLIVHGQMRSIAVSAVIVLLLVTLIMRSVRHGVFSILPMCMAIAINFGIMGMLDIPLDAATAISACVAIGIGIDYGLHFLNRYRLCRDDGQSLIEAVSRTAETTGGSICINALSVAAGFSALMFSSFIPLVNLGFLIALTMLTSSAGSLTLLPATLALMDGATSSPHKE